MGGHIFIVTGTMATIVFIVLGSLLFGLSYSWHQERKENNDTHWQVVCELDCQASLRDCIKYYPRQLEGCAQVNSQCSSNCLKP